MNANGGVNLARAGAAKNASLQSNLANKDLQIELKGTKNQDLGSSPEPKVGKNSGKMEHNNQSQPLILSNELQTDQRQSPEMKNSSNKKQYAPMAA